MKLQEEENKEKNKGAEDKKKKERQDYMKTHKNKLQEEFKSKVEVREAVEKVRDDLAAKEKLYE